MAGTNGETAPRRKWVRIALVVSLAVNLAIVGLVAGAMLGGPRDRDRNPALRDLGFGPFVSALPREDQRAMGRALIREAGAFRENRAEMRAIFEQFLAALRADPYDPQAVQQVVSGQLAKVSERQDLGRRLLLERIEAMDSAGRAAYADALDHALKRGRERRDRR